MKKWILPLLLFSTALLVSGCSLRSEGEKRLETLDFTVVENARIPEDFFQVIQEQKSEKLQLTFQDGEEFYLCVGYGKQNTGGYSIAVKDLYRTEGAIHFQTELIGPSVSDADSQANSYPYVVIRMEPLDLPVLFERR